MACISISLTYSKNIYILKLMKRFYSVPTTLHNAKLIQRLTESSKEDAVNCIKNHKELESMSEEELTERIYNLDELNLSDSSKKDKLCLIKHHPKTIKHRYLSLREFGFHPSKISSIILSRYLNLVKQNILSLKKKKLLEEDCDVVSNVLSYTPLKSSCLDSYSITSAPSLYQIKVLILRRLLIDVVGYEENFRDKDALFSRLKHKSIVEILRNISVLQHQVELPLDKIRNNPFLLSATDADNTLEIMSTFPTINDVDVKTVLNCHPKILVSQAKSLLKIYQHLVEANISDTAISKCFEVFTLNTETVKKRLEECKHNHFFSIFKHHPRILELILYQNKVKSRIEKLKEIKVDFVSLHTLSSCDKYFNRFFEIGSGRHHGLDIVYYVCKELDSDKTFVQNQLKKHPYWYFSSLLTVSKNVQLLFEKGFTKQDILSEICIILYPTKALLEELDKVKDRPESQPCKNEQGILTNSKILSLTLYFLEKESHFTGNAIWLYGETPLSSPNVLPKHTTVFQYPNTPPTSPGILTSNTAFISPSSPGIFTSKSEESKVDDKQNTTDTSIPFTYE